MQGQKSTRDNRYIRRRFRFLECPYWRLLFICIPAAGFSYRLLADPKDAGQITNSIGIVEISTSPGEWFRSTHNTLRVGEEVRTGAKSRADIEMYPWGTNPHKYSIQMLEHARLRVPGEKEKLRFLS